VCAPGRERTRQREEREREHLERVIEIEIEIVCEGCRVGEEGARAEGRPSYPIPPWLLMSRYSAWAAILHHAFAPCKPVFSPHPVVTRPSSDFGRFFALNNRSKLFGFQNVDPKTQSRLVARSLQGEARCRERRLEPGYREPHACVLPHRGPRSRESVTTKPAAAARLEFQDLVRVSDGGAGRADGGRGRPS
jgi:hypothetical protein